MRDFLLYIDDITDSAKQILEYTKDLSFEQFSKNRMVIDAVIRNTVTKVRPDVDINT